ncbi:MAG: alpha/beta hydrolase [Bacteroidales bacterium]|nr:alpha/beta hydrolase [Bacteroidales bacterium]
MKSRIILLITLIFFPLSIRLSAAEPERTCTFAEKDGQELKLDFYPAAQGSQTQIDGKTKPAIIFVFGGGFIMGERDNDLYKRWFSVLNEEGYPTFSIDYRLGMKDVHEKGIAQAKAFNKAVDMAVEDLFSAVTYIVEHAGEFGVSADNLVISGCSAGAMTVLKADWVISNTSPESLGLPEGFSFKGVISFSGAVLTNTGKITYRKDPAPTLMFHGIDDRLVNYKGLTIFNWRFWGTHKMTSLFRKNNYVYNTYRFVGDGHDIAASMMETIPEQIRFLEADVTLGIRRILDNTVEDPSIPEFGFDLSRSDLY